MKYFNSKRILLLQNSILLIFQIPSFLSPIFKFMHMHLEPRLDKSPFGNGFGPPPPGLNPMAAQFMALNHPAALNAQAAQQAAQAAHAAFLSQTGAIPHFPGLPSASSSPSMLPGGGRNPSVEAAAAAQFMKNPGLTSLEALQR